MESSVRLRGRSDGRARFVNVEQPPVQPAVLVQIAARNLQAGRVSDAAGPDRLKPGGADQAFGSRRGNLVVGRIEQDCRPRSAIAVGGQRRSAQRPERLHVVSAGGEQPSDDRAGRHAVGEGPDGLAVVVEADGIGRIDDDLAVEEVGGR